MIIDNLYENFLKDTGLTNVVYKSVFTKIDDILNEVKNFNFLRFVYKVGDQEYSTEFEDGKVPLNVVEIINNIFQDFHSFPPNSSVVLFVEYREEEFQIVFDSKQLIIPSQISFLKELSLFDMFLTIRPVNNLFKEFDRFFKFTNTRNFSNYPNSVYVPLKSLFDAHSSEKALSSDPQFEQNLNEKIILLNKLQLQQTEISEAMSKRQVELSEIQNRRGKIDGVEGKLIEIDKQRTLLKTEHTTFTNHLKESIDTSNQILEMIKRIDAELSNAASQEIEGPEIEFLKEKRIVYGSELELHNKNIAGLQLFIKTVSDKITLLESDKKELEKYIGYDVYSDDATSKVMEAERDKLYSDLMFIQDQIKKLQIEINSDNLIKTKSDAINDPKGVYNKTISTSAIIDHLSTSLQPSPIVTVLNYLRYYFVYCCEKTIETIKRERDDYASLQIPDLYSIASRIVLSDIFGIEFQKCFSIYDYKFDNHSSIITVIGN
jgi:hypothetical protein